MMTSRLRVPLSILITVAAAAVVLLVDRSAPVWASAAGIGALAAGVLAVSVTAVNAYPMVALLVTAGASVATGAAIHDSVPVWSVALSAGMFAISLRAGRVGSGRRTPLVLFGVAALGALVTGVTGLVVLVLAAVLPWVLGRGQRQQDELVRVTAERARLRERARIAHDMHDTLGHELSLVALRAAALELDPALPPARRQAAAEVRAGVGRATERLAEIVTLLRDDRPAPLHPPGESIDDLVHRTVRAGLPVTIQWLGTRDLPESVGRTAYRVVQEALTNVVKHAPAASATVVIATADGRTTVTVANKLPVVPPAGASGLGSSSGLVGLAELTRIGGGSLRAGPRGHEFEVVAELPHAAFDPPFSTTPGHASTVDISGDAE